MTTTTGLLDQVIAYEQGDLDDVETLDLFGALIADGTAWRLQGHYGRTAASLIQAGFITPEGEVLA